MVLRDVSSEGVLIASGGETFRGADSFFTLPLSARPGATVALLLASDTASSALWYRLKLMGFDARALHGGRAAAKELARLQPDVVVVDVDDHRGPKSDLLLGLQTTLRRRPGIFAVSSSTGVVDRIVSLECGAEDHLRAPIDFDEVALRLLRFIQWRSGRWTAEPWYPSLRGTFTLGPIRVEVERRAAFLNDQRIPLTAAEMRLLCYLAEQAPSFRSRQQLLADVWSATSPASPRTMRITTRLKSLRNKLEGASRFIESVPGVGVRLSEAFQPVFPHAAEIDVARAAGLHWSGPRRCLAHAVPDDRDIPCVASTDPAMVPILERELPGVRVVHLPLHLPGPGVEGGDSVWAALRTQGPHVLAIRAPCAAAARLSRRTRESDALAQPAIIVLADDLTQAGALHALELGADDVQGLPLVPRELGLRVRALLRRQQGGWPAALNKSAGKLTGRPFVSSGAVLGNRNKPVHRVVTEL